MEILASKTSIWKYMFSNPSSTVCYSLNSYSSDPHGQLMINDNQLFFLVLNVSNKSLVYVKATPFFIIKLI